MIALIMAGGVGTRFWPLSRESNPKQFLKIVSDKSMIQMTVERLLNKIEIEDIFIVTAKSQVELIRKHIPELPEENIIIEPFGMNTAPCIALSALYLSRKYDKKETMIVLPADHLIKDEKAFLQSLDIARKSAEDEYLVTFGIKPDYPTTGYGYVESEQEISKNVFSVKQFKEKPDIKTAESFLKAGNFFWNSGMFMWKIETILKAFQNHLPEVASLLNRISIKWDEKGTCADISDQYTQMPKLPIDIGIMEKAEKRVIIPVDYGWNDVGSWKALYDVSQKDENKNVMNCESEIIESRNNYVNSDKFVALIGVENLIIVDTKDALLISRKADSEQVKEIVNKLKDDKRHELL
ncbi:MAG: mannose-1-phosphate guanylyltransferase [Armatimonadetes bacterium]|nr:mannose-1-phosphate guanylyltransferase [Armatimonadota bacterium]